MNDSNQEVHLLTGLEADNLLAFLALMGLLRSLETSKPEWKPRVSWQASPWRASLHLRQPASPLEISSSANDGVLSLVEAFDVDGHRDVGFSPAEYRSYVERVASQPVTAALAAALTAEFPQRDAKLHAAPLVMMFGQGHQHFLDRLLSVPRGELPTSMKKLKNPPNLRDPEMIRRALFERWTREDETDAFRWDPAEDQRYALRFGDPSRSGAPPTMHGANRLAAVGFLSFPSAPSQRRLSSAGFHRTQEGAAFVWPVWTVPLSRQAIEDLLVHPSLTSGSRALVSASGVAEVFTARRISNGKFVNVTRASPLGGPPSDA